MQKRHNWKPLKAWTKLDESTVKHAGIWSHPGHYLVDPYTWPWSPNGHCHGHEWPTPIHFVQCLSVLPFWDTATCISKFDHENPWSKPCMWSKVKVTWSWKFKGHGQGQTWWSHLRLKVQSICLLFVLWQLDHFWLRYSKFHIWPWKFKAKVMAKVKLDGHIWSLKFNWYICFSFHGNWAIFGRYIANSITWLK